MTDVYAANPLVDEVAPAIAALARREAPAPTLFPGGDLPAATASGNPPRDLMRLPWNLRHAAAKADQAEWARLMNEYAGTPDADVAALFDPATNDPGNLEYKARVGAWVRGDARHR